MTVFPVFAPSVQVGMITTTMCTTFDYPIQIFYIFYTDFLCISIVSTFLTVSTLKKHSKSLFSSSYDRQHNVIVALPIKVITYSI